MVTKTVSARHMAAWRSLLVAHAELIDRLGREMEAETGLPLSWYEVLLHLGEAEGRRLRMHVLAESLLLSRSAATRFVDRMEHAGLVERCTCASDRRGTFVAMTEEGLMAFTRAAPVHLRGIEEHFAAHVTDDEATQLIEVMDRLTAAQRAR
jgi:DNA-binding MarR family transcriptional regulator